MKEMKEMNITRRIEIRETTKPEPTLIATNGELPIIEASDDGQQQLECGKECKKLKNLANVIGEYGYYQFSLTVLIFIRYVCVAMMTNTGPLLAPTLDFWCVGPPNSTLDRDYLKGKCNLHIGPNGTDSGYDFKCTKWIYNTTDKGLTLTDEFDLVCDRDWLRSLFQSTVSIGVVLASVVFGSFSDEHGRKFATNVCYIISLISGLISIVAPNFAIYALSRSICSMSDLGIVGSLYIIIVETLGKKFRGTTCLIVYTGWSMGVMIMPWITGFFMNFRHVMMFTVACHLLTLPWLITVGESIRWLLINARFFDADLEVKRILSWKITKFQRDQEYERAKEDFEQIKEKFLAIADRKKKAAGQHAQVPNSLTATIIRSLFGGFLNLGQIYKSRKLFITTITIIWIIFNSELLYMLFIMINSDVGGNVKLNYAIGGLMELLATLVAIVMISSLRRKLSLSSTLVVISLSIFCLAFTYEDSGWSVFVLNFTKLAISTLSSLINFTATELFPTNLRQSGMGLAVTLGCCGDVVAPFIRKELTDLIGLTNVMLSLFLMPLSAAIVIPFCLQETKDVELPDDIDDIEEQDA